MSYSIDANILLYASDTSSEWHRPAKDFLEGRVSDPDILCLTWPVLLAYQRIATHPGTFARPLPPDTAWANVCQLLSLPRATIVTEKENFADDYQRVAAGVVATGNLVPDAQVATILLQHGVRRIYSADTDFRKFDFLEVINPLGGKTRGRTR
jgi:toxin-antitoxin system PIN domain toxin